MSLTDLYVFIHVMFMFEEGIKMFMRKKKIKIKNKFKKKKSI
jgi:hypothetical protein